jgi:ABC-type cobalt transport system substrate-binding protein
MLLEMKEIVDHEYTFLVVIILILFMCLIIKSYYNYADNFGNDTTEDIGKKIQDYFQKMYEAIKIKV